VGKLLRFGAHTALSDRMWRRSPCPTRCKSAVPSSMLSGARRLYTRNRHWSWTYCQHRGLRRRRRTRDLEGELSCIPEGDDPVQGIRSGRPMAWCPEHGAATPRCPCGVCASIADLDHEDIKQRGSTVPRRRTGSQVGLGTLCQVEKSPRWALWPAAETPVPFHWACHPAERRCSSDCQAAGTHRTIWNLCLYAPKLCMMQERHKKKRDPATQSCARS
jgi:hypothetical protein